VTKPKEHDDAAVFGRNNSRRDCGIFPGSTPVSILRYQYGGPRKEVSQLPANKETRCKETERKDYLELIARIVSHIPDKGQVTIRYFGLYADAQFSSTTSKFK
jgi:hypothetical protein